MTPVEPVEAASLLVLRDGDGGLQVYMVRRHPRSRFLANALVFVGGRCDPEDGDPALLACCNGLDAPAVARRLYVTAARECFEEAGLLLAESEQDLARPRERLNAGELSFRELLERCSLSLELGGLRYLDRWLTPEFEQRRYDTHFFACRVPAGQEAVSDPKETSLGAWLTIDDALRKNRANELHLYPPTLTILEGLRDVETVDGALSRCPDRPLPAIMSRPLLEGVTRPVLLLPGDHRYDDPGSAEGPEHYVVLVDGHWERVSDRARAKC